MLAEETEFCLKIVNKDTGKARTVDKFLIAKRREKMNLERITLQDCIDMCEKKSKAAIINDGKVVCFVSEE